VCYGSDLNFAPILPMCYGCYGSRRGKGAKRGAIHTANATFPCSLSARPALTLFHRKQRRTDLGGVNPGWIPGRPSSQPLAGAAKISVAATSRPLDLLQSLVFALPGH